ncbi:MAG TPA: coagulation factor 5/8 type domain-containing protein [Gaiellaceae bacterium]
MLSFVRSVALALATALLVAGAAGASQHTRSTVAAAPDFGPNVKIIDPSMSTSTIQAIVDGVSTQQLSNEFGTQRYALLFKPGTYGSSAAPLNFQVGYYTEVAGLGSSPNDVSINGTIDSYNQCSSSGCTALTNFWRSVSNLTINVAGKSGCRFGEFWAVSQAAPMRRVHVNGYTTLMDYCTGPSYASGGFIADSQLTGASITSGSQQQFLVRNSVVQGWSNAVWNQVFAGVPGAPAQSFPNPAYTTLATNPASREKPYLYVDASDHYNVFVPDAQFNASGTTWANGQTSGHSLPIESFFIAKPTDSVQSINNALSQGKNLIFTPGVYEIDKTIKVKRADTVVLGLGMATLTAEDGVVPMTVADVKGVDIAGLIFDAGPKTSPTLLQFGDLRNENRHGDHKTAKDANDPGALQDVFFRIGGPHAGKAIKSLVVGRDNTILDDIWAWRADHGSGVGWTSNTADTGVVVTGDNVVATGLFVEHFQKYEVLWAGENGKTIMFQNEMPYDPPNQLSWQHNGVPGWASYKVADWVKTHEAWGVGGYCFLNVDPTIHAAHVFEVPVTPGVRFHDLLDVSISGQGTIDHVINDVGAPNNDPATKPVNVVSYP